MPDKLLPTIPDHHSPGQTRREFCLHACQTVSILTLGAVASGCGGPMAASSNAPDLPVVNASLANGALVLSINAASPLASVGGAALVQTSSANFLLARTGQDTFSALTAVCTHESCKVTGFSNQRFVCPCHGSEFNTSGGVTRGPASSPLRSFPTQFANNVLTVTV